ncbi:hypothetical protein CJ739_104 [Mariniflexile rhizosphaerae]|nr:hypothetical protein CJ739_104 [Mariniflexile sp. TRM1-10]
MQFLIGAIIGFCVAFIGLGIIIAVLIQLLNDLKKNR